MNACDRSITDKQNPLAYWAVTGNVHRRIHSTLVILHESAIAVIFNYNLNLLLTLN